MSGPEPIPFQPDRFRSAAPHYLRGRTAYADALIHDVALLCGLDGTGRLLDLGCGPGQLTRAFRPYVESALGMDPEPEMLAVARQMTDAAGLDVEYREGSSQDLAPGVGPLRLVTIGRAFHWMDRPETARRLDELLAPGGALVLFSGDAMDVPENPWKARFEAALEQTGAARRQPWRSPGWVRNDMVLLSSPFSSLRRLSVIERRQTPGAALLDRALSMSSTTKARLGDAVEELRKSLDAIVAEMADADGMVTEVVESVALIAQRPG
jgi:SAM-dependent methyltransferase